MSDNLLSEEWLAEVGFKWHEVTRSPHKHWVLWLGDALDGRMFSSQQDLGIELTMGAMEGKWFCWLRSDVAGRYSRFLHVRHLYTQAELIRMVEGLTGQNWNPENHFYGGMVTHKRAEYLRAESERLDRYFLAERPKWNAFEKDPTRGGALPQHLEALEEMEREIK